MPKGDAWKVMIDLAIFLFLLLVQTKLYSSVVLEDM